MKNFEEKPDLTLSKNSFKNKGLKKKKNCLKKKKKKRESNWKSNLYLLSWVNLYFLYIHIIFTVSKI